MRVEPQKSHQRARHRAGEDRDVHQVRPICAVARRHRDCNQRKRGIINQRAAAAQPVQAVQQVRRIHRAHQHEHHYRNEGNSKIPFHMEERHRPFRADRGIQIRPHTQPHRQHDLRNQLLLRREPQRALEPDLDEIVHKADRAEADRADKDDQKEIKPRVVIGERRSGDHRGNREDHAAHRGRALLFLVGIRLELINRLPEFQLFQPDNHPRAEHHRHRKRGQYRPNQPLHLLLPPVKISP